MMARLSFTAGMTPDFEILERVSQLKDGNFREEWGKYRMLLNPTDLLTICHALDYYWQTEAGGADAEADIKNAAGLRSSILETLGIEEI